MKLSVFDRLNFDTEVKQKVGDVMIHWAVRWLNLTFFSKVEKTSVFSRLNFGDKVKGKCYKEIRNRRCQEEVSKDGRSQDGKMGYQGKGELKCRGKENRSLEREQPFKVNFR